MNFVAQCQLCVIQQRIFLHKFLPHNDIWFICNFSRKSDIREHVWMEQILIYLTFELKSN